MFLPLEPLFNSVASQITHGLKFFKKIEKCFDADLFSCPLNAIAKIYLYESNCVGIFFLSGYLFLSKIIKMD